MADGTGTVICKLCDEPLKVVKTKDGKTILGCECPDKKYQMDDVGRLLGTGELDAVEYEDDDEDDDFSDDEDDFDDDDDDDEDEDDEQGKGDKPKGPTASTRNAPVR